jgi:hypothetical protein
MEYMAATEFRNTQVKSKNSHILPEWQYKFLSPVLSDAVYPSILRSFQTP